MAHYEEVIRFRRSWPWWRWALTGLSALALALNAYLSWHYVTGGSVIGCGGPGAAGCEQVLNSRWSMVGSVLPVTGLAAGAYLAMLVASLFIGPATTAPVRRLAWGALLVLIGAAVGSAVWFTVVQKWILRAFCPYCMAIHTAGLLLAALVIWRAPKQVNKSETQNPKSQRTSRFKEPMFKARRAASFRAFGFGILDWFRISDFGFWIWLGLALAGVLAASQAVLPPAPVYRAGESHDNLSAIDTHAAPLVGSPDARYIVKLLFDYQCPHCQQMHFMLNEVVRRYGGQLAFALCPTPLDTRCNPYIPRDVDKFKNSCRLAKVCLAVWLANRKAFPTFELWMFTLESGDRWQPRSLEDAKAKAVELVGQAKFEAAWADPWIDRYLQTSVKLFGATGSNAIPKLVYGSRWVIPQPYDADGLVSILQDSLGVPAP